LGEILFYSDYSSTPVFSRNRLMHKKRTPPSMNPPATALTPLQQEIWSRAVSQIEAVRSGECAFAQRVRRDLLQHPGYFAAARKRTGELLGQHRERPHWRWAWERWAALFSEGGLPEVLKLLEDTESNQELISASPFAVMRPPLPENDFYRSHARA